MDLTTNGVVITDAIKFVHTNKEKLTMSTKDENNGKESKEPDYEEDRNEPEGNQDEEIKRNKKQQIKFSKEQRSLKKRIMFC